MKKKIVWYILFKYSNIQIFKYSNIQIFSDIIRDISKTHKHFKDNFTKFYYECNTTTNTNAIQFFFLIFYQWFKNDAANYIFKLQSHLKQGLVDIIVMVIFRSWSNFVEEFYKFIPGSSFGWATRQELRPSWSIRRKFIAWTNDDIVQLLLME